MGAIRRQFIDGEYGQLHLRVAKPANPIHPPLYCLHMSPKSGRLFEAFMRGACQDRIMVAPDYPGYGESAPPPGQPHVRIEDYARNMWHVADHFQHEKVDLLGFHTGAEVAVEMTRQHNDRVRYIAMISTPIFTDKEQCEFEQSYRPLPLDEEGNRFRIMWERIKHHRGPGMTLEMMATSLAENLRGGEHYEWGHRAAFAYVPTFKAVLPTLTKRIIVFNPKDDLYDYTRRAEPLLRNGKVIDCPNWGHGFLDAYTEEAVQLIMSELDAAQDQ